MTFLCDEEFELAGDEAVVERAKEATVDIDEREVEGERRGVLVGMERGGSGLVTGSGGRRRGSA